MVVSETDGLLVTGHRGQCLPDRPAATHRVVNLVDGSVDIETDQGPGYRSDGVVPRAATAEFEHAIQRGRGIELRLDGGSHGQQQVGPGLVLAFGNRIDGGLGIVHDKRRQDADQRLRTRFQRERIDQGQRRHDVFLRDPFRDATDQILVDSISLRS